MKNIPDFEIELDQSIEYGVNMSKLIDDVTRNLKDDIDADVELEDEVDIDDEDEIEDEE